MKLLDSLENTENRIDFVSFDYYIDPKNHRFTGSDAVREITFYDRCVWPILSEMFTFATHSSDSSCNERMTERMNSYLLEKKNLQKEI